MKRFSILLAAAVMGASMYVTATDITTQKPGTLSGLITEAAQVTSLKVTGPLDARDFRYIGDNLSALTALDLSQATVEAYNGDTWNKTGSSPAATLPMGYLNTLPLTTVSLPAQSGLVVENGAFAGAPLTTITFPSTPITLATGAFAGCNSLQQVTIPANVTLSDAAFAQCTQLTTVTMQGVTQLPVAVFHGCTALNDIQGTATLTTIGDQAFKGCTALQNFDFGPSLKAIGAQAFASTGLTAVNLQGCTHLTAIGDWAFAKCAALTDVTLPQDFTTLGEGVFFDDNRLTHMALPEGITELPDYSLKGARLLNLDDFGSTRVSHIGNYAMLGNDSVSVIQMPETLSYLGDGAMEGMTGLITINVAYVKSIPQLGRAVWAGVDQPKVSLRVWKDHVQTYRDTPQWQDFNIEEVTNLGEDIVPDGVANGVKGAWMGTDLLVTSLNQPIARVTLLDPQGRLLVAAEPHDLDISINTADFDCRIFLVAVTLEDGTRASLKMARR